MQHLFESWRLVAGRLRSAPQIALFLDFDGTLVHFREKPEDVHLPDLARYTLAQLSRSPRFLVWVISGRRQADIRSRIGLGRIRYLGLYGWEGRVNLVIHPETRRLLGEVRDRARAGLEPCEGIWIEDKEFTFSVHYRGAAGPAVVDARKRLDSLVEPFHESLDIVSGKKVWDVVPRALQNKGAAVRQQLAFAEKGAIPIYIGDDSTDEPAFKALPGGVTVRVGRHTHSSARYRLSNVEQVKKFLAKLRAEFA
ncbi:MAG: trehalose-phosphatase [Bryobacteraceae bacterium]